MSKNSPERFCVNPKCLFFDIKVPAYYEPKYYHSVGLDHTLFGAVPNEPVEVTKTLAHGQRRGEAHGGGTLISAECTTLQSWSPESRHEIGTYLEEITIRGHLCGTCFEVFKLFNGGE